MNLPKNRWLAFAYHFGISLLIFLALLLVIVFFWYPGALFAVAGGWQGIRIVIGVDLVLGPFLTLMVYNRTKPDKVLLRDLAVIALIQLSCLTAGVFIVYKERPVAVTYTYDKFYVLKNSDFIKTGVDPANLDLSILEPTIFYINIEGLSGESGVDKKTIVKLFGMAGKDLSIRADLYAPFPENGKEVEAVLIDNKTAKYEGHGRDCITVELISAFDKGLACFNSEKQSFSKFVSEK